MCPVFNDAANGSKYIASNLSMLGQRLFKFLIEDIRRFLISGNMMAVS
jgi:hypothetical protein